MMVKGYYEKLYVRKFCNIDEIEKFLKRCKSLKLIKKRRNPSSSESQKKFVNKFVNKNLPTKKTLDPGDLIDEFYQTFEEEIILILHKVLRE